LALDRELSGQAQVYRLCTEALIGILSGDASALPKTVSPELVVRLFLGLVKLNDEKPAEEEITF
jgi:hypothetical protein